jgi:SulP family sulfate permease
MVAAGVMAVLVGLFRLAMGLARLGMLVSFVSDSVVVGFTAGAGVLIVLNQIRNLLRLLIPSAPNLWTTVPNIVTHLPGHPLA